VAFFLIKDLVPIPTYERYKYHFMVLVIVDASYLLYRFNTTPKQLSINEISKASSVESIEPDKPKNTKNIKNPNNPNNPNNSNKNISKGSINSVGSENLDEVIGGGTASMLSIGSLSFDSESNDFRVSHDLSSEENEDNSLYSTSEEKPEIDLNSL